jgi:hypothetical protein
MAVHVYKRVAIFDLLDKVTRLLAALRVCVQWVQPALRGLLR